MKPLKAKDQIVLVLCHLMGRRRSFEVGNWVIEMKEPMTLLGEFMLIPFIKANKHNGSTYSRKWRELKGEDYYNWFWGDPFPPTGIYFSNYLPTFTKSDNTWHLPKEFCKFLRAERDRILRGAK